MLPLELVVIYISRERNISKLAKPYRLICDDSPLQLRMSTFNGLGLWGGIGLLVCGRSLAGWY